MLMCHAYTANWKTNMCSAIGKSSALSSSFHRHDVQQEDIHAVIIVAMIISITITTTTTVIVNISVVAVLRSITTQPLSGPRGQFPGMCTRAPERRKAVLSALPEPM